MKLTLSKQTKVTQNCNYPEQKINIFNANTKILNKAKPIKFLYKMNPVEKTLNLFK